MSIILHRDPRTVVPDIIDWFEEPFLTLRPYMGQAIKIEDYTEDGHYVVRAEIAGIDPEEELEVLVAPGYLTIHAERSRTVEGKHRSEFRYGSLTRTLGLPPDADTDGVTAQYAAGILTVTVSLKGEQPAEAVKKVRVTPARK